MSNVVAIETSVQGATAEQVEEAIAVPLEQALHGLPGVTWVRSSSTDGACRIEVEYDGEPTEQALHRAGSIAFEAWKKFSIPATEPHASLDRPRIP